MEKTSHLILGLCIAAALVLITGNMFLTVYRLGKVEAQVNLLTSGMVTLSEAMVELQKQKENDNAE